jgi:hypothetical protein
VVPKLALRADLVTRDYRGIRRLGGKLVHFPLNPLVTKSIHMDWRELIRIGRYFNLLGIETHSIPLNPYGLE